MRDGRIRRTIKTGTNIWDIMDVVPDDEDRPLMRGNFRINSSAKVYIMLGVNELGEPVQRKPITSSSKRLWRVSGTSAECVDLHWSLLFMYPPRRMQRVQ